MNPAAVVKEETFATLKDYQSKNPDLFRQAPIFNLPVWMETWWGTLGGDFELFLRSFWEEGELLGIAPLMGRNNTAFLVGSADVCDYLDFIVAPGKEKRFFDLLLPYLAEEGYKELELQAQRPDTAVFAGFFSESGGNVLLPDPLTGSRWRGDFRQENESAEINLPAGWEEYLALLNKKQRHEVRRKLRRLLKETGDYQYRLIEDADAVRRFVPQFLEIFKENPDKESFLTPEMEEYFLILVGKMADEGMARFGLLDVDGVTAAVVLCFDDGDCIYLYNSGYRCEYARLSAGFLSKIFCLKESIERGRRIFDFLKGSEAYKLRLGGRPVPIYRVNLRSAY
ncbi:MAG: GNAT family N-acetyltransferase [Bacillota bacterium]|nr:GNAT family N-acetyltransferase [Bacillota bacterium]